jgi:hypothetical protein
MLPSTAFALALLAGFTLLESATCALAQDPLRLNPPIRRPLELDLNWQGGVGPFQLETLTAAEPWSDVGGSLSGRSVTRSDSREQAFFRVLDLGATQPRGARVGVLETAQGEFGDLLGRHRLKSRWTFHSPTGAVPSVPSAYFRSLVFDHQSLTGDQVRTFTGTFDQLPGVAVNTSGNRFRVNWATGSGAERRSFVLTADFPYPVGTARATRPRLSDARWTLDCTYATSQPVFNGFDFTITRTTKDSTELVQLATPAEDPVRARSFPVQLAGVRLDFAFTEGSFLVEGAPPWILKTQLLNQWTAPTRASGAMPEFTTDSYFARTVLPGHHNFYHELLVEPALDPSLSPATRSALRDANIRFIHAFHPAFDDLFGNDTLAFIGFDDQVRVLKGP